MLVISNSADGELMSFVNCWALKDCCFLFFLDQSVGSGGGKDNGPHIYNMQIYCNWHRVLFYTDHVFSL